MGMPTGGLFCGAGGLQFAHVSGLRTLRALDHLERHTVTFAKAAEALGLGGLVMHKDILVAILGDEPLPLLSLNHLTVPSVMAHHFLSYWGRNGASRPLAPTASETCQPVLGMSSVWNLADNRRKVRGFVHFCDSTWLCPEM